MRYVDVHPRLLHGMQAVGCNVFNRANAAARGALHGGDAGADCLPVLMHGAGPAQGHAAAELGSRQSENVSQIPEQRHIGFAIERALDAVDLKLDHA
jgi:hypothetical protein